MNIRRALVAVIGAAVLFGALASAASARNLEITTQRLRGSFRRLEFHLPGATTTCEVTVEGSFHSRTTAKVLGSLVGYITRVDMGPCASGTVTILTAGLPWHIRYSGFTGTLPTITSIIAHVLNSSLRVRESGGVACLAGTNASEPGIIRFHRETVTGVITGVELSGTVRTGAECFGVGGSFRSERGPVSESNTNNRVTIRLI
jgi:hypothetical protein